MDRVTVPALQQMKRDGRKIVGVVCWDCPMARVVDRAGVEIVSVGDTYGMHVLGHANPLEVTMDEMLVVTKAVRRGTERALVSVDFPFGPLQQGTQQALDAALRFVKEAGVDMVKLDGAAAYPQAVEAIANAGIAVFAQFGITPQTALRHGVDHRRTLEPGVELPAGLTQQLVAEAQRLESAGAALLDFTHSGPVAGPAVTAAVGIPVLGGLGGGPWLDGRIRMIHAAIGYAAAHIDRPPDTYAQVAATVLGAIGEFAADVRAGRQIRGGIKVG